MIETSEDTSYINIDGDVYEKGQGLLFMSRPIRIQAMNTKNFTVTLGSYDRTMGVVMSLTEFIRLSQYLCKITEEKFESEVQKHYDLDREEGGMLTETLQNLRELAKGAADDGLVQEARRIATRDQRRNQKGVSEKSNQAPS